MKKIREDILYEMSKSFKFTIKKIEYEGIIMDMNHLKVDVYKMRSSLIRKNQLKVVK